jgi:hypothetical protein
VRITRTHLVEAARREVERRAETDGLVAAYLIGSIVHDQAVFGGAADIDLVLVHDHSPDSRREIVGLSDEVHLDIAHHHRDQYAQPRLLRLDPWLGPAIYDPLPLHDPQHFFEWAQASARGQFLRPDHRAARASAFLQRARRLQAAFDAERPWVSSFARAALCGANAIATLAGQPVAGRRLLLLLDAAAAEAGCPEAYGGLLRLLGAEARGPLDFADWVSSWARAYDAASSLTAESDLLPERRDYYLRAFQAQLDSATPQAVLYTLLDTWERTLATLSAFGQAEEHRSSFDTAATRLELTAADAAHRFDELEAYFDHLEAFLEEWSARHGA